ncbi:cysteine dioxygenase family protein [Paraburkholderia sp.]|uniref:cysteine dioxygenase family protein n=1 Tax=Paraburkholderia sp. TaxID=1926495 RepID=UPI0023928B1E|nr:cysteine dioxygenase family protein [Paraburkholderia sp.]MDE1184598.1 cysteine dioxygenase family protein [Paraburkholderia sp.]
MRLCAALDAAFDAASDSAFDDPAFGAAVRAALAQAVADPALLTSAQREGAAATYRRHLLAADPRGRYAIASLVWMPGQASPVHAHHTWCGYAVIDGTLTESVYRWDDARQCADEIRSHPRTTGAVSFAPGGRDGVHRLMNVADADTGAAAVSLHIYGVSGEQIATHVNDVVAVAPRETMAA